MPTYSTLFFSGAGAGGPELVFTVPSAQVCVIRDIEAYNGSSSSGNIAVSRYVSGSAKSVVWVSPELAQYAWAQWQGRVVLNAGDELYINCNPAFEATISGYLLAGP